MAKGFDKLFIKRAAKAYNQFSSNHEHLTTMDFGQLCVLNYFDCIPGDKHHLSYQIFCRNSPLNFPVYGDMSIRTVNFFVPYFQVADEIEGYFSGQKMYHGTSTSIRYTTLRNIMKLFTENDSDNGDYDFGYTTSFQHVGTSLSTVNRDDYNFVVISARSGSTVTFNCYKLTTKGRYVYKVLRALGYDFPANIDLSQANSSKSYLDTKVNLLPLLAFFKAYNDWLTNSVQYNSSVLTKYLQAIRFKDSTLMNDHSEAVVSSGGYIDCTTLCDMFDSIRLLYDSDYFTSAWRYPNKPYGDINVNDVTQVDTGFTEIVSKTTSPDSVGTNTYQGQYGLGSVVNSVYSVSSRISNSDPSLSTLSARQLNFLRAFDDWVRRNNYAGTRAVNQIYARFGIKPTEFRSQYADFISKDSVPLRIGDVTQTSQTTTIGDDASPLGSYAGKGIADGSSSLQYECNDYGCLLTLAYIWVDPLYYRGFHRNVLKIDPLDFYNPEFDGVGPEAISMLELYNDPKVIANDTPTIAPQYVNDGNQVFGFTERYNSERFTRDQITGDFSLYDELMPWHFGRDLSSIRNKGVKAQSNAVVYYTPTSQGDYEYDRIFATTQLSEDNPIDHFYLTCQFKGTAIRPMMNASQSVMLGDGDLTIDRLGQQIS